MTGKSLEREGASLDVRSELCVIPQKIAERIVLVNAEWPEQNSGTSRAQNVIYYSSFHTSL